MPTAAEALAHGWSLHQAGHKAAAEQVYRQVLQAAPNDANAWCYLGMACHDQDRFEEAVAAYRRAIQLQPDFPIAYNNLGNTLRLQKRLAESLAAFDQALRLKPGYVNAIKNKGTALVWEGHLDEAVACYQEALKLNPDDAESHKNLGVVWLLQGRFGDGWREYEWRWKTSETSLPKYSQPQWDGTSLDGRTILLASEQGLGDVVQFVRYAARLKELYRCRVIVAAAKALHRLLASCPGIDELVTLDDRPAGDVFAPLLNVPGIFRDTCETFPTAVPYLTPDPELVARWRDELSGYGGYRVGIAWQGNPQHQADRMRSVPLTAMLPLGRLAGVTLFSLQKGHGVEQIETVGGRLNLLPLGARLDEQTGAFMDTVAVLKNLDLLITSDTAIAHVAGAIGVPVWVALSHVPDWRWLLGRDDTPWYPTMRLFRQTRAGDWTDVVARMANRIAEAAPVVRWKPCAEYRMASSGMNRLISARHGLMLYNRHDIYIGRSLEQYGEFSEPEVDLFRQLVRPGSTVVEAGANIGAHTLPLSEIVGERGVVHAFEPQRVLFQTLCANMALNSRTNVYCRCEAVGAAPGSLVVPALDYRKDNNFGGLGLGSYKQGERVPVVTIDSLGLPRCDFLKADVEGMELSVLQGAQQTIAKHRPVLYVENDRREGSAKLIEHILSLGYNLYWHLPPMYNAANYYGNAENVLGKTVSANMLGVHRSVKSSIQGLLPITSPAGDWRVRS